jgi:hypothetical protein
MDLATATDAASNDADRIADSHSRLPTIGMVASTSPTPAGDASVTLRMTLNRADSGDSQHESGS